MLLIQGLAMALVQGLAMALVQGLALVWGLAKLQALPASISWASPMMDLELSKGWMVEVIQAIQEERTTGDETELKRTSEGNE